MTELKEVREKFRSEGLTVTAWAHAHGFDRQTVYALLGGRLRGDYGAAHRVAVALGLKAGPKCPAKTQGDDREG
jgi:gp16 family phage-associated protein